MNPSMDVVVDIETTGTVPGCCILSIGATDTHLEHTFYSTIWHSSQKSIFNLKDDFETLKWWDKQDAEARNEAFSGTLGLQQVLGNFADWLKSLPAKKVYVWGNGADFDQPILAYAYNVCEMQNPFGFNNRCYRTLKNLYPHVKASDFEGRKHHALDDARHEALHLSKLLRYHFHPSRTVYQD